MKTSYHDLSSIRGKIVRVTLNKPLYLNETHYHERFRLSEESSIGRPPVIKEVVGYLRETHQIGAVPKEDGYLVINPFGKNNLSLSEESNVGDVEVNLRHINSLEAAIVEIFNLSDDERAM